MPFGNSTKFAVFLQKFNGFTSSTAPPANPVTESSAFSTLKKSCLRSTTPTSPNSINPPKSTQESCGVDEGRSAETSGTPTPPAIFRDANGSLHPLLASVLSKLETADNGTAAVSPDPPKPQPSGAPVLPSFEENLKAAIARRRKQMNQSRESSESEEDFHAFRAVGRILPAATSQQVANTTGAPGSNAPQARWPALAGRLENGGTAAPAAIRHQFPYQQKSSVAPKPPPPPPPPPPQANGIFRNGYQ
ncbi:unnamed protein product [Mesocestoides corti]|uniref:WH2 domain-containing protein n=1 Tax=Mesocestoides corti TaxID=53468 RepID=A0A0R3ULL6_MESCO|nr:unnamed protein product [Mesocestoides corti]